jgi:hypothetical protein
MFAAAQTKTTQTVESSMITMVPATSISSVRDDVLASLVPFMIPPIRPNSALQCVALNPEASKRRSWDATEWDIY